MTALALAPRAFEPDAFDALLQEHAEVGKRYAALYAEYGPGCLLDNKRKAFLATLAAKVRVEAAAKNLKVTEAFIDEQAHAAESYREWIEEQETGRLAFELTALDLERVQERLRHLDLVMRRGL